MNISYRISQEFPESRRLGWNVNPSLIQCLSLRSSGERVEDYCKTSQTPSPDITDHIFSIKCFVKTDKKIGGCKKEFKGYIL